jgi:hypothetical protein
MAQGEHDGWSTVEKGEAMSTIVQCTLCELRFRSDAERRSHLHLDHGQQGAEVARSLERMKEQQRQNPKRRLRPGSGRRPRRV